MTKVISKRFDEGKKCGCCNWRVLVLYSFTTNPIDEEGPCGDCFMDMMVENKWHIRNTDTARGDETDDWIVCILVDGD